MKKFLLLLLAGVLVLLFGCVTQSEQQYDLSAYYSMVYGIGQDAFQPIAEEYLDEGDRVLIVNIDQGFSVLGMRYQVLPKPDSDPELDPYEYNQYLADHPFFIEYMENGFINSFLVNGGIGFDRMELARQMGDYIGWLRDEKIVFNTSRLSYDWWEELREDFDITKVLLYSVHNIVAKDTEYIGMQLGLTFLDVEKNGKILYDRVENVVSSNFPDNKRVYLPKLYLEIPKDSISGFNDRLEEVLLEEGIVLESDLGAAEEEGDDAPSAGSLSGIDAILVKGDDIPELGTYPITKEDFVIEKELLDKLGQLPGLNLLEKLYPRRYKTSFQFINAVNHINPFRGGEYAEFEQYYGAKYMLEYKVLWAEQTGKIENVTTENIPLDGKVLGVYLKLIDMTEKGRILLTHFLPIGSAQDLQENFLYKCFTRVNDLPFLQEAIEEVYALGEEDNAAIINKRMEIYKNYLISNFPAYRGMIGMLESAHNGEVLTHYDKIYKLFDEEERSKVKGDIYYVMAGHIVNAWIEEGLTDFLVRQGYRIYDKLESIYSRYLLTYRWGGGEVDDDIFLSPIKLADWGADIKNFYDLDKIIYFIGMEKAVPDTAFITPDSVTSEATAIELSQFYPILSPQIERLLFSVLDVNNGDYSLNKNFSIEKGGE